MKLDGSLKEALVYLAEFLNERDIPFAVIGALAPVLMIDFQRKNPESYGSRITKDVDVSIRTESWQEYEAIKTNLVLAGFIEKPGFPEHTLFYNDVQVDIIPFWDSLAGNGVIEWPRSGFRMSVRGFEKVFPNVRMIQIEKGTSIPVIPIPLSIFLKIVTWLARQELRDLEDIVYMLEQYEAVEVSERRFDVLGTDRLDYESSGAYLAGKDLKILELTELGDTMRMFMDAFPDEDASALSPLALRMNRTPADILRLIRSFRYGLGLFE